jgi:hypothetical protein
LNGGRDPNTFESLSISSFPFRTSYSRYRLPGWIIFLGAFRLVEVMNSLFFLGCSIRVSGAFLLTIVGSFPMHSYIPSRSPLPTSIIVPGLGPIPPTLFNKINYTPPRRRLDIPLRLDGSRVNSALEAIGRSHLMNVFHSLPARIFHFLGHFTTLGQIVHYSVIGAYSRWSVWFYTSLILSCLHDDSVCLKDHRSPKISHQSPSTSHSFPFPVSLLSCSPLAF